MKRILTSVMCLTAYTGVVLGLEVPRRIDEMMNGLLSRQEEEIDPAKRECHENCGNTIVQANPPNSCNDTAWTELFEGCLDCALEFDIWKIYGDPVTGVARACELDATPKKPKDDEEAGSGDSSTPTTTGSSDDAPEETESPSPTQSSNNPEGLGIKNRPAGAGAILLTLAVVVAHAW